MHSEAAQLLLRLVWLGGLRHCASIAREAAYDRGLDSVTRVFAGRALLATGGENIKEDYAGYIIAERSALPEGMVRDAIAEFFPSGIGVGDLLSILQSEDSSNDPDRLGFQSDGPGLVDRLDSPADIEQLLAGLLTQLGGELGEHADHERTTREGRYFPAMIAAALRLLKVSPPEIAPDMAVDAILRVGKRRHHDNDWDRALTGAMTELHRTKDRRRSAFWRAAQSLRDVSQGRYKVESPWQMGMLGYRPDLQVEDVEWLLGDGLARGEHDRRLAVNSAMAISRSVGAPAGLDEKVAVATAKDPIALEAYDNWTHPPERSAEEIALEQRAKRIDRQNATAEKKREQSWINFIRSLGSDSARVGRLRTPPASGVNRDLYDLWQLLDASTRRSGYAISSVSPLEKIAGPDVADATRAGLIAHWRSSSPLLRSQRDAADRNSVRHVDLMGIAGVSLEAASYEGWAASLSPSEATVAAGYATLELNGFPGWMFGPHL
jgi:hypothetical protein